MLLWLKKQKFAPNSNGKSSQSGGYYNSKGRLNTFGLLRLISQTQIKILYLQFSLIQNRVLFLPSTQIPDIFIFFIRTKLECNTIFLASRYASLPIWSCLAFSCVLLCLCNTFPFISYLLSLFIIWYHFSGWPLPQENAVFLIGMICSPLPFPQRLFPCLLRKFNSISVTAFLYGHNSACICAFQRLSSFAH